MERYQLFFKYVDEEGKLTDFLIFDTSKSHATDIAKRFMEGKTILLHGTFIPASNVKQISFFKSDKKLEEIVLKDGSKAIDAPNQKIIYDFTLCKIEGVRHVTYEFIKEPPAIKTTKEIVKSLKTSNIKNKIFIVHGRNENPALRLQKYLTRKLGIEAEMFEDLKEKSGSATIIEILELIKNTAMYAFVIITPDDYGCLCKNLDILKNKLFIGKEKIEVNKIIEMHKCFMTRARQNVVFELGLFIGSIGRDNVCCLFHEETQEKPSDIDGILYVPFKNHIKETFAEITEKLNEKKSNIE